MTTSIFSLLTAVLLTRALFVATELNIAEYLDETSLTLEELSCKTSTDKNALRRLLYFLELNEVFIKDAENKYSNNEFSCTLCANHPQTIKPLLLHDDETRWNAFGHLGYSIKTGKAAFDMLYNENYFHYLKHHSHLNKRFDEAMVIISQQENECIARTIPFHGIIADIGGGKGQLLNEIIKRNPNIQGILFDLPATIQQISDSNYGPTKIAGSFFEPISIYADIFILKRILHDWDNDKATHILRNVSSAMHNDSTLYIIDGILDYAKDKKLLAALDLALLTIFQGKERTMQELTHLLASAHLEVVRVIQINDLICALECKKRFAV